MVEIRQIRDRHELEDVLDLLGALLPGCVDTGDRGFDELTVRFPADQPLMVVARAHGDVVGGALGYRHDDAAVILRIIAVVEEFRHRGIGRCLPERVETAAGLLGAQTIGLGADEAVGFWCHLGYTTNLLFQWVYDADRYEGESEALLSGPLSGLRARRSSSNEVPQLFVQLDEPRLDLRHAVREMVTGCHVGFTMSKHIGDRRARP
ncbi:MAG: GNAT family N-acetyltransferase [Actinomycetota bacterium]|nr:GNAT family N-acetyltransferase [Actinomycetota bacterium]